MLDALWTAATCHPFLDSVREGAISDKAFDRWLAQDALFVAAAPYDDAITALWGLERVYLMAWTTASSEASPFGKFVEHWTQPGFADCVEALAGLASTQGRDDLIAEVLSLEIAFWDMAMSEGRQW